MKYHIRKTRQAIHLDIMKVLIVVVLLQPVHPVLLPRVFPSVFNLSDHFFRLSRWDRIEKLATQNRKQSFWILYTHIFVVRKVLEMWACVFTVHNVLTLNASLFSRKYLYFAGGRGIGGKRTLVTLKHTSIHKTILDTLLVLKGGKKQMQGRKCFILYLLLHSPYLVS